MELKYIITDRNDFAIFTKLTNHSDIGRQLHGVPISAGCCKVQITTNIIKDIYVDSVYIKCYGKSISMRLKSNKNDSEHLTKLVNKEEY